MSAQKRRRLIIRPAAKHDIDDVLLFTQKRWGIDQRRTYRDQLNQAMRALLDNPDRGRARDDLAPGLRGLIVERHIILYRVTETEVIIGHVMHQHRDITSLDIE